MRYLSLLVCAFALIGLPAAAQSPSERFVGAEQLLDDGDALAALSEARAAYLDLWQRAPLTLRAAALVQEPAENLGLYSPKDPPVYGPGEPIYVYFEPVAYGWVEQDGKQRIAFTVDASITTPDGTTLFAKADFTRISVAAGSRMTEFFANLTYNFTGLEAGQYTVVTTLNDMATGKSVKSPLDFSISE